MKETLEKKKVIKIRLALTCDRFVNGEDRIAGYVVVQGECVGDLSTEDINRYIQGREIKAIEGV